MRDELYIDGKKADIDSSTSISLNYKSNFLTDISKIVSNNSYTIKLPKTANNLRIIECAHIPSAVSNFPYLIHAGTLVRDGVEIIRDANVVLLSVGEQIEIALSWGTSSNFASIVNDDKSLQELDYGMAPNIDYVEWENEDGYSSLYPRIEYGFRGNNTEVWVHPVVTVKWIMDKISSTYGITFDFPSDRISMMESMIVPLLTRDDAQKQIDFGKVNLTYAAYDTFEYPYSPYTFTRCRMLFRNASSSYYMIFQLNNSSQATGFNMFYTGLKLHIRATISIVFDNFLSYVINPDNEDDFLRIVVINPVDNRIYASFYPTERIFIDQVQEGNTEYPRIGERIKLNFFLDEDFELQDDSQNYYDLSSFLELSFFSFTTYLILQSITVEEMELYAFSENIAFKRDSSQKVNNRFYFVPNLPDIKQIDFLKSITSMLGLFAIPSDKDTIKFIKFDTVVENKSNAVDWSNRLISAYFDKTPQDITYTLDDFAQHNRFLYKEDDDVKGNYDGDIVVDNQTLDYERDAVELPFSGCDTRNGVAYIPIYSYDSNGELEYDDSASPRILLLSENKGIFSGLEWETLLSEHYEQYKSIISKPRVIVEYIRLTSVELQMLDLSVPVYLSQYGSYWVIISVKTKKNDICEVKLLKM